MLTRTIVFSVRPVAPDECVGLDADRDEVLEPYEVVAAGVDIDDCNDILLDFVPAEEEKEEDEEDLVDRPDVTETEAETFPFLPLLP